MLADDLALIRLRYLHGEVIRLRDATKKYRKIRTKGSYKAMRDREKEIDALLDSLAEEELDGDDQ